jgi:sugar-specific transcriptional regulator TrmB
MPGTRDQELLSALDLKEYEQIALEELLVLGRTTAPDLSEASGIPKARIYGVLESLANRGLIKIVPGRPKEYQPKSPEAILERVTENRRQEFETYRQSIEGIRDEFVETFQPLYEQASDETSPTSELFYVVDVGDPSETETRALYRDADEQINVITKSFEYFDRVRASFESALAAGIDVSVLFLDPAHLSEENRRVQREAVTEIETEYPDASVRFSEEKLPWRGTFIDPDMDYETGKAILLVEEKNIPLHKRQAAVTENESFVAGMNRYFDLIWEHESFETYPE